MSKIILLSVSSEDQTEDGQIANHLFGIGKDEMIPAREQ